MQRINVQSCPLCLFRKSYPHFPWRIRFNDSVYHYFRCEACSAVYIHPLPSETILYQIYDKEAYHDLHYTDIDTSAYERCVKTIEQLVSPGARILDYGCGTGKLLKLLKASGFDVLGVEIAAKLADHAAIESGCDVKAADAFFLDCKDQFDVIHIGDVLEHLTEPASVLASLESHLKPNGYFYIEGPLEDNPSLVYLCSRLYAFLKKLLLPTFIGDGVPSHIWRVNERTQRKFFERTLEKFVLRHWCVYETGWPYIEHKGIKYNIGRLSVVLGGKSVFGYTLGNRFTAILKSCSPTSDILNTPLKMLESKE
jgi:2-polyprenyl-3-methyl-5-hydroxy-6-metoxy-1,4-benzoquinol methylase